MEAIRIERSALCAYYEQNREREFLTMDNGECPVASFVKDTFPIVSVSIGRHYLQFSDTNHMYHVVDHEPWLVQHIADIDEQGPPSSVFPNARKSGPITGSRCLELLAELDQVESANIS